VSGGDATQSILAIGDACGPPKKNRGAVAVAGLASNLVAANPETLILLLGDNAYNKGRPEEYQLYYEPVLGIVPLKRRTRACPGNHDYRTAGAAPYFATFGSEAAGTPTRSYYSFDLPCGWHVISLNSEVEQDEHSPQVRWLREDLATRRHAPILAFWHRPRWGSGAHRDSKKPRWFWKELASHRAEIVLNGHAHHYERFAPQKPNQVADPGGIRQFIVGTGGRNLSGRSKHTPNSEVTEFEHFGLLRLELSARAYLWEFITIDGPVLDAGRSATNH
jgi:3',5'-cyclic AMP phosphodiesterase CpdA